MCIGEDLRKGDVTGCGCMKSQSKLRFRVADTAEARAAYHAEKARNKANERTANLDMNYLATCMRVKLKTVPKELLEIKREQLILYRLAKQLKKAANETLHEHP